MLKQCMEKLKSVEASRLALVCQLKEALHEQESELENIRTQMQVAQARADDASNMRKRLKDEDYVPQASTSTTTAVDINGETRQATTRTAAAIAAEVVDKLAASSSSQLIMHSVLSTFAAEEAKNAGLINTSAKSNSFTDSLSKPSDPNVFILAQSLYDPLNHSYQSVLMPPAMQNQVPTTQNHFHLLPKQYLQPSMTPDGYGSISPLPPGPPPPPSYMVSPMMPLTPQPSQLNQQQPPVQMAQHQAAISQQEAPGPPGFRPIQPPGILYYSHLPRS